MKKIILVLLIALTTASLAAADTIYLRGGRTVRGTVLGFINGRFAVRLMGAAGVGTQTSGQGTTGQASDAGDVVFIRPRDIERIEIDGRSLDEARYLTRTVQVELGPNWIDTGVDVRRGQRLHVDASGTIYAGRNRITPGGLRSTDPSAPLPRAAEGVLIGAISNDPNAPIIEIGLSRDFVADRDGRLYLTVNRSSYTDARGAFTARVRSEVEFRQQASGRNDNRIDDQAENETYDYDPFGNNTNRTNNAPVRSRETNTGNQPGTSSQPQNRSPLEKVIEVPGNSRGTDTGIDLRSGDRIVISASGSITAGRRAGVVSPDGGRVGFGGIAGTYPVANVGVGALVGYLRLPNGQMTQPFAVGSQLSFTSPTDGRLFLLINDDNYGDNSGSFSVRIVY
ncbi:MAG TPA: LecA/PA-IL family lectin [Pyrinomonadaceae bacterium]